VKKAKGRLVLDWLAEVAILVFLMNLLNQLKLEELRWGEKSVRAMIQSFKFVMKRLYD